MISGDPVHGPSKGRARRIAILELVPDLPPIIEVGCDHGHTARALGAIGTERLPHRLPRRTDVRLVVADGLRPFRHVGVAIIAGMGAAAIARILDQGPRPQVAVLHAPDRPGALRRWCASHGWRIEAERLAPEAERHAEILRVVPGVETATGLALDFGPRLLEDPYLQAHLAQLSGWWGRVLGAVVTHDEKKAAEARRWLAFLDEMARKS